MNTARGGNQRRIPQKSRVDLTGVRAAFALKKPTLRRSRWHPSPNMSADEALELGILMESLEDAFPAARVDDFHWNMAQPKPSGTFAVLAPLVSVGYVAVVERVDQTTGERMAHLVITANGKRRMNELIRKGVEPAEGFD